MENGTDKTKKATLTVIGMMVASLAAKGLGLMRSVLMASHYGAGTVSNAFSEASHIPLTFFDLLFAAAISGCFIPVYNGFVRKNDGGISEEADKFACSFFNVIALGAGLLALVGIIFADVITGILGLDAETKRLAATLLRIMFPMVIFTGTAYVLTGVLQSRGNYLFPAIISAFSNAAIIIYFVFFDNLFGDKGIYGLAFAYLIAWFLQLVTLALPLIKSGFRFKAVLDLNNPEMRSAVRMVFPIMISSWLAPAGLLVAMYFTSFIDIPGAVTVYDYANQAFIMIAGILTYSICNYSFPKLSRLATDDDDGFKRNVRTGTLSALALTLIFAIALYLLSDQIVAVLYFRGEFTVESATRSASALRIFAFAVPAYAVIEIGNRVFFAKKTVKYPMLAAIVGIVTDVALAAIFVNSEVSALLGVGAVAAATCIGIIAAAVMLVIFVATVLKGVVTEGYIKSIIGLVASAALGGGAMFAVKLLLNAKTELLAVWENSLVVNAGVCFIIFVPGALIYVLCMRLFKVHFTEK